MNLWEAYVDDSGTHDDSIVAVAGLVFSEKSTWDVLGPRWRQALNGRIFHAAKFNSSYGDFKGLGEDERRAIYSKLLSLFSEFRFEKWALAVYRSDFDQIAKSFPIQEQDPFRFLLDIAVSDLLRKFGEIPSFTQNEFSILVESKEKMGLDRIGLKYLNSRTPSEKISMRSGTKGESVMLELADFVAYEGYIDLRNRANFTDVPERYTLGKLSESGDFFASIFRKEYINSWFEFDRMYRDVIAAK